MTRKRIPKIGEFWRLTAGKAFIFRFKRRTAISQASLINPGLDRCHPDQYHAGANHIEIFRHSERDIDHPPPMLGMHAIIDLDDGAAVGVQPAHCHLAAEREMIAGAGK